MRPCGPAPVIDLSRSTSASAQLLCADGRLLESDDDGQTWSVSATVPGGRALDSRQVSGVTTAFVAARRTECDGVGVSRVVAGVATNLACVPAGDVAPGEVSLSVPSASAGRMLVGSVTWRAGSALGSWSKV